MRGDSGGAGGSGCRSGSSRGGGEWTVVGRKRKWSRGGSWVGGAVSPHRLTRCFRCLGRGHLARFCRYPPRCWRCGSWGHRSPVCKSSQKRRAAPVSGVRAGMVGVPQMAQGIQKVKSDDGCVKVELQWSEELDRREEFFS
ncbi:hypothetical protein QJS04_geneDACA014661 [Acorus gramineus]|uniref:CCHC-type domain-containing protein n=1 Tax=Acorus gramineus TaxID=55184 RepID=A0AAV9B321_ACOGR|nr:hypothetical protein QJS04_geneDACA014661 [Acorus gramineus]